MGTEIRPELSKRNKYHINKYRYYELKYYCLQYPIWQKEYFRLESSIKSPSVCCFKPSCARNYTDTVSEIATQMRYISDKMALVEETAAETDDILGKYVLKAVTEGRSYVWLRTYMEIPCGKNLYYDIYHRFFWLLSRRKHVL